MEDISNSKKTSADPELKEPGLGASSESVTNPAESTSKDGKFSEKNFEDCCDDCPRTDSEVSCDSVKAANVCCKTGETGEGKRCLTENENRDACESAKACENRSCCCTGKAPNAGPSSEGEKMIDSIKHRRAVAFCDCQGEGDCRCGIGGSKRCCIVRDEAPQATSTNCQCSGSLNPACQGLKTAEKPSFDPCNCEERPDCACYVDGVARISLKLACCQKLELILNIECCRSSTECCCRREMDKCSFSGTCYKGETCCRCRCGKHGGNRSRVSEGCLCLHKAPICWQRSKACAGEANIEKCQGEVESSNTSGLCCKGAAIRTCCKLSGDGSKKTIGCCLKSTSADSCFGGCSCSSSLSQCCSLSGKMPRSKRCNAGNANPQNDPHVEKSSFCQCPRYSSVAGSLSKDSEARSGCRKADDAPALCAGKCSCCENCCSKTVSCCQGGSRCLADLGTYRGETGMSASSSGKKCSCCSPSDNCSKDKGACCDGKASDENCSCECNRNNCCGYSKSSSCGTRSVTCVTFRSGICTSCCCGKGAKRCFSCCCASASRCDMATESSHHQVSQKAAVDPCSM